MFFFYLFNIVKLKLKLNQLPQGTKKKHAQSSYK